MSLITTFARALGALAGILFLACSVVIVIEIVARYAGHPTSWAQDIALFSMIAGAFLCQASVMIDDGHVRVDAFINQLSEPTRQFLIRITLAAALVFIGIVFWYTLQMTMRSYHLGLLTTGLFRVPVWLVQCSMPIGFGALFLAVIVRIVEPRPPTHAFEGDGIKEI